MRTPFHVTAFAAVLCGLTACGNGSSTAKQPDSASPTPPSSTAPVTTTASATAPPSAGSSAGGAPTTGAPTTTAAAGTLLPDEAIQAAITGKQELLIVRVKNLAENAKGSRSDQTTYVLEIVQAPMGTSTGTIQLSHYGTPRLTAGHVYAITTREGNPMWGTKGLRESVEIPAGQESAAATAHADRVKALRH